MQTISSDSVYWQSCGTGRYVAAVKSSTAAQRVDRVRIVKRASIPFEVWWCGGSPTGMIAARRGFLRRGCLKPSVFHSNRCWLETFGIASNSIKKKFLTLPECSYLSLLVWTMPQAGLKYKNAFFEFWHDWASEAECKVTWLQSWNEMLCWRWNILIKKINRLSLARARSKPIIRMQDITHCR